MQEAWLMNEMSKAQNLVQENSRLLINAPHARIAFLPFFALKMVFFPLLCPVGVRKSAEGRAPVAMQLVQLLQLVFFDTTDATSE